MSADGKAPGRRGRAAAIITIHVVLLAGALAWGGQRLKELDAARALPALRAAPLEIRPLYDDARVAGDAELRAVLGRLGLRLQGPETSIGKVEHALRLWGPKYAPGRSGILSGKWLRALVTNHPGYATVYGPRQPPLLIDAGSGVRVRAFEGPASSPHADHTLASLAEIGTPANFFVVTPGRVTTFKAMAEQSLREFSLNQAEVEWSALAYALLLPPVSRWTTSEGQEMTFDRLAARLMRERLPEGVCSANHRLHALVVFLRADDLMAAQGEARILSPEARRWILGYLREVTATLVRHQHADGFWNGDWPVAAPAGSQPADADGDRLSDRLIVTGHVLEWWALAPEEVQPPRRVVVAAGRWLVGAAGRLSDAEVDGYYTFLSHVGRALALWRGVFPAEVDRGRGGSSPRLAPASGSSSVAGGGTAAAAVN